MTEDKFEQLVRNHPELFQKAGDIEFSVGDGWFTIIDTLCGLISYRLENAKRRLKFSLENPDAKFVSPVAELEADVETLRASLPTLVQVKEKFGSLRFYYDGGDAETQNYVSFAEALTYHTCEICGAPGKARNDGWVKVLCDAHQKEREEKNNPGFYPSRKQKTDPKLSDET